jgi:hypothetical protein
MTERRKLNKEMSAAEMAHFYHSDGVFEMIVGAVLLNFGLDVVNNNQVTSLFAYLPIILFQSIKSQVFFARINMDDLGVEEKKLRMWALYLLVGTILSLVVLGVLVLGNLIDTFALPAMLMDGNIHSLVAGVIIAIASAVAALFIPLKRFWIYTLSALVSGVISFFYFPAYVPVFFLAVLMLGLGIWQMVKFRKAYPPLEVKAK